MVTAVVAQTKDAAKRLARELGVDDHWGFGARCESSFIGLRAALIIVDDNAEISDRFMQSLRISALKGRGMIKFASELASNPKAVSDGELLVPRARP